MPISVRCPSCDRDYQVRESFAGRTVPCKDCGAVFLVPQSSKSAAPGDGNDDYDAGRQPRPASRPMRQPNRPAQPAARRPVARGARPARRRRSGPPKGLVILMCVLAVISVTVASSLLIYKFVFKKGRGDDPGAPEAGFAVSKAKIPSFPELPAPRVLRPWGASVYFVDLGREPANGSGPGERMKMRVYLPRGAHADKSLGCVLVAPAGTTLLHGNDMDDDNYHAETLPYVLAGYAVVFYSLDGPLNNRDKATDAQMAAAYDKFKAAKAGVLNGRNALEFVLAKLSQVNPDRIYCAGHSSAATLSLLLAAHEPRIKGCIAYAPATDLEERLKPVMDDGASRRLLSGLRDFVTRSSPKTHADKLNCPVFIHHARDDGNVPFRSTESFVNRLRDSGKQVEFSISNHGGHYNSMLNPGIPRAIAWLRNLPQERTAQRFDPPMKKAPRPRNSPFQNPPFQDPLAGNPRNSRPSVRIAGPAVQFSVLRYSGAGDAEAAARRALTGIGWIDAGSIRYDAAGRRIVARVVGRRISTGSAKQALRREGFVIGFTRYSSRGL
jgi:dienelactone hydrolase